MANTITFTYGETSINLPSPNYPSDLAPSRPQIKGGAVGGRAWVTDLGDGTNLKQPKLTWKGLPESNWDDLYGFINGTVNLAEHPFQFTDWDGNTITVRYWGGLGQFPQVRPGRRAGTLSLREEPA